jgi:hypothetical protein
MNIQQVIARRQRKQRKGKGKFGNLTLNHWIAPIAVGGRLRYGADTQIERSGI